MARAKPTISPTDSPRTRKAVKGAAVTAGLAVPPMISSSARSASPAESVPPAAAFLRVSRSKVTLELQEVLEQVPTALGEDALRVKLDALDRALFVTNAHDHPVLSSAGHDEALRDRLGLYDERVVTRRLEALRQAPVHPLAVVQDLRGLAVHGLGCAHDLSSVGLAYS